MDDRLKKQIDSAQKLQEQLQEAASNGSFAHHLSLLSVKSHLDELSQLAARQEMTHSVELLDFRINAPGLETGSMPLGLLSKASNEIRKMIGYAALRLSEGGLRKQRVSDDLYRYLNLRLVDLLPGSSRLVVAADAQRDLFDEGLAKSALARIFAVLNSRGEGQDFLEAVSALGISSSRQLRNFLCLLLDYKAEIDLTWTNRGHVVWSWKGDRDSISSVSAALDAAKISETDEVELQGVIELLSKRERLHLRIAEGGVVKVLYPEKLLPEVSQLHLDQRVTLYCRLLQSLNPHTGESSTMYELLGISKS